MTETTNNQEIYTPESEHHVDVEDPAIKSRIIEARKMYESFFERYREVLDLECPSKIDEIYEAAKQEGIFKAAQEIRELIFGKDIHFYGVTYLWDSCAEHCLYCPLSVPSRVKLVKEGVRLKDRRLSADEAVRDVMAVMDDGHKHICILTGSTPGKEKYAEEIIPYIKKIMEECNPRGLKEIILNVEPLEEEGFKKIALAVQEINKKLGSKISLQFRVFQETYNRSAYVHLHPRGTKSDYDFRYSAQARALRAGFDNVGLGALFGLHHLPLEEIENLRKHAEEIENEFGKIPARVCLPSANELAKISVMVPYRIERNGRYEKLNELIYALTRLAMPKINIVSSERDTAEMLEALDRYATCTTLNVHPGVGDNINRSTAEVEEKMGIARKKQTTSFPRDPAACITSMRNRSYNPII